MIKNIEQVRDRLFELPDIFNNYYWNKEYYKAKSTYDTARTVALFIRLDEDDMLLLFGERDKDKVVKGLFDEELVQNAYWDCIKKNHTNENRNYPGIPNYRK